ncbi:MAG: hypothetical protein PVI86_11445, partial [Phycisphaerae bacterium]
MRSLVVATATLAILLVLFSIYQYSQLDSSETTPTTLVDSGQSGTGPDASGPSTTPPTTLDGPGVQVGEAIIGEGERIRITIYRPGDHRAQFEIEVSDWTPVGGSVDEFLLTEPEVRMRTKDGHAVRVVAKKGVFQASGQPGSGLEPLRGKLEGDVKIEYDRLTTDQRARLPEALRATIDPAHLVTIELDEIEFDLEYSKVVAPGRLRLTAREAQFEAGNVEVRFNERESRVEFMRIGSGGRLMLRDQDGESTIDLPGLGAESRRVTLSEWLWATMQAKLTAEHPDTTDDVRTADLSTPRVDEQGIPIFRMEEPDEPDQRPPMSYTARFEGNVDARQVRDKVTSLRLQADTLQILRDLSDKTDRPGPARRNGIRSPTGSPGGQGAAPSSAAPSDARLVVDWEDRLVVQACTPDDPTCRGKTRSKLSAAGAPARISRPDVEATCGRLTFEPDTTGLQLYATDDQPVSVRYAGRGTMTARSVRSTRTADKMHVFAEGPGMLTHEPAEPVTESAVSETDGKVRRGSAEVDDVDRIARITFSKELEVEGRFMKRRRVDFTGSITSWEERVLDRATFVGNTQLRQEAIALIADTTTLVFETGRNHSDNWQAIDQVNAKGDVLLTQDAGEISCQSLDIHMTSDNRGRPVPH